MASLIWKIKIAVKETMILSTYYTVMEKPFCLNKIMCIYVPTHVTLTSTACLCDMFVYGKIMGQKGVPLIYLRMKDIYQILREYCSSLDLQYQILSEDLERLVP